MLNWLREAADHPDMVNDVLLKDFRVERGQLDEMWLFIQKKGPQKTQKAKNER